MPFSRSRSLLRLLALLLLGSLTFGSAGCGIYRDYPLGSDTPWPLVQLEGGGHERARALVLRPLDQRLGGQDLDGLHQEVVDSGLFADVQTRASEAQKRPSYDYVLRFELTSQDDYSWVSWLGLIPGFPLISEERFVLTCQVLDGQDELLGEVSQEAVVDQALGILILPFNLIYTILPGRSSPYDLLSLADRRALMVRALTRDVLMQANEKFDFRPPSLRRRGTGSPFERGLAHLRAGELPEAERAFQAVLRLDSRDELAWYNLACTYARADQIELAFPALEGAIRCGYRDRAHLEQDEDLAALRAPAYAALYAKLLARIPGSGSGGSSEPEQAGQSKQPAEPEQPAEPAESEQPAQPEPAEGQR